MKTTFMKHYTEYYTWLLLSMFETSRLGRTHFLLSATIFTFSILMSAYIFASWCSTADKRKKHKSIFHLFFQTFSTSRNLVIGWWRPVHMVHVNVFVEHKIIIGHIGAVKNVDIFVGGCFQVVITIRK